MRAAARLVDWDISDAHADLERLEVLGVLELEAGGPGGAMQPVVPFDRIEMHIDYPLLDDHEGDGASVNVRSPTDRSELRVGLRRHTFLH